MGGFHICFSFCVFLLNLGSNPRQRDEILALKLSAGECDCGARLLRFCWSGYECLREVKSGVSIYCNDLAALNPIFFSRNGRSKFSCLEMDVRFVSLLICGSPGLVLRNEDVREWIIMTYFK